MARRLRSATAVMSTTALATSAASTNRQLVLRPPSTGTDRKNHTRDERWGSRRATAAQGRDERWGVWGAISGPPIQTDRYARRSDSSASRVAIVPSKRIWPF